MRTGCKKTQTCPGAWLLLALLTAMLVPPAAVAETGPSACNPVVRLAVESASLQETLSGLSRDYGFSLVFSASVERPVSLEAELPLEQLLKALTTGLSTSLIHGEDSLCDGRRLTRLILYPVGEQGEPAQGSGTAADIRIKEPSRDTDYIYIDDMEQYVEEVFLGKRRPELKRMTPEQRAEYRDTRRRVKKTIKPRLKSGELSRERRGRKDTAGDVSEEPAATNTGREEDTGTEVNAAQAH
jgi:hypothetical protein